MSKAKIIIIILSVALLSGGIWFGYSYFSKSLVIVEHPFDAIPDNNAFIMEFSSGAAMEKFLESDVEFLPVLFDKANNDSLFSVFQDLGDKMSDNPDFGGIWNSSKLYFSAHFMGLDDFSYLITVYSKSAVKSEVLKSFLETYGQVSKVDMEGAEVFVLNPLGTNIKVYVSQNKGVTTISLQSSLMQKVIFLLQKGVLASDDPMISRLIKMSGQGDAHLYINHDFFYRFLSQYAPNYRENVKLFNNLAARSEFDIRFQNNFLLLAGYSIFLDSTETYSKVLAENSSIAVTHFNILPINTLFLAYQGAGNYEKFYHSMQHFGSGNKNLSVSDLEQKFDFNVEENILPWINGEVSFCITSGPGGISDNSFSVLTTTDIKEAWQQLNKIADNADLNNNQIPDTLNYRAYPIRKIDIPYFVPAIFGNQFSSLSNTYITEIDNYIIIANSQAGLKRFIDLHLIGQNLSSKSDFESFSQYRSSKMNLYFYFDLKYYNSFYKSFLGEKLDTLFQSIELNPNNFDFLSLEISAEDNGAYTSLVLSSKANSENEEMMPISWQVALDADIQGEPFIFTNHNDGKREMLIFDSQNFLYRIDEEGKLQWKIPIQEAPMSNISVVDFYKNGKFQYIFNSANYLYLIDLNGNRVDQFPFKLPATAIGSMSLMDYDGKNDYRVLIPLVDGKLHNFTLERKPTPGWEEPVFDRKYISPVEHYRLGSKDFLLFEDTLGNVVFANRRGESRIEAKLAFTNNPKTDFFIAGKGNNSRLITTDLLGRIIQIDGEGNVEKTSFSELSPNHIFQYCDYDFDGHKDYVFYDNHKLTIYDSDKELIFDTVLVDFEIDKILSIEMNTFDSISLILHNRIDNSLVFITTSGKVINSKEFISKKSFLIEEATNNKFLRLITINKRIVSNFLIK